MRYRLVAALAMLCLPAAPAFAGVLWTAEWSNVKPNIIVGDNQILVSKAPTFNGDGDQTMLATHFTVAMPFTGDSADFESQNYLLQLTLKDNVSGQTAVMDFSGDVSGTISPNGSTMTVTFDVDNASHAADLGSHHYVVTMLPYEHNGEGTDIGTLRASVTVTGGEDPGQGTTNPTPEPTTATLMLLGVAGGGYWMRRRR